MDLETALKTPLPPERRRWTNGREKRQYLYEWIQARPACGRLSVSMVQHGTTYVDSTVVLAWWPHKGNRIGARIAFLSLSMSKEGWRRLVAKEIRHMRKETYGKSY